MTHKIGDMIAAKRKERGLTQEDVCLGICETATLSKIENGKHFPTKARLDAILQRLDLDASRYQGYISDADFEQQELQYEVVQRLANGELEETQKALVDHVNLMI